MSSDSSANVSGMRLKLTSDSGRGQGEGSQVRSNPATLTRRATGAPTLPKGEATLSFPASPGPSPDGTSDPSGPACISFQRLRPTPFVLRDRRSDRVALLYAGPFRRGLS